MQGQADHSSHYLLLVSIVVEDFHVTYMKKSKIIKLENIKQYVNSLLDMTKRYNYNLVSGSSSVGSTVIYIFQTLLQWALMTLHN